MQTIINEKKINQIITQDNAEDACHIREVLAKSLELNGLNLKDIASLIAIQDNDLIQELFKTAQQIKETIYGNRLVLFAPLYISNLCSNNCLYCAFRSENTALKRRVLTQKEIAQEVKILVEQGHKRLLLEAGETYNDDVFQYVLNSIETIYSVNSKHSKIRRLNVNIAPLTIEDFKRLKSMDIGTYQLFQETYHQKTYQHVHPSGKKSDYHWRLDVMDRAMQASIDDVGIGVLFGLADWRFEILALIEHANHLNKTYGIGPHTISIPRIEPASGSALASQPPHAVSDNDFCKLIAILRLAVPYTGLILSTRETELIRRKALALGISQLSAGSRTNPGGYAQNEEAASQFSLGDHRPLDEVIRDIASLGYIPSFCTACYRLGRTGHDFMNLAKPGKIKTMCTPNAIATFKEYLRDYASPQTIQAGETLIQKELAKMPEHQRTITTQLIDKINNQMNDIFI